MAEGLARRLVPEDVEVFSAGSEPSKVNPLAVEAMQLLGIDLSTHESKGVDDVPLDRVDLAITLCAEEVCPTFSGEVTKEHWPLDDPAARQGTHGERLTEFVRIRNQLDRKIRGALRAYGW